MKAQKSATKTQVYFQQKRKCKINITATCNFKSATQSAQITGCCKYRHLSTDCFITVRMILDGHWDMSFAALRLQETRNATAATLLTLSEVSIFSDNNNIVRFNTRFTRLHGTSKTHISVFLAVIFAKFVVFRIYTKQHTLSFINF